MPVSVLSKWGNNLALRVPKEASSQFKEGDHLNIFLYKSGLHFKKAREIKQYDIKEVLESISPKASGELDWGKANGKEI